LEGRVEKKTEVRREKGEVRSQKGERGER